MNIEWQQVMDEYGKMASFIAGAPELLRLREEVRGKMGSSSRELLYGEHSVKVYRYAPPDRPASAAPLLVVPSLINRPSIMDLLPGESFIEALRGRGFSIYMIEWGDPNPGQKKLPLESYLDGYLGRAVRRVLADSGASRVSLGGYCLGGLLALLYASRHPEAPLDRLVTMVTPVNFHDRGMLSWWAHPDHFDVSKVVNAFGNVPAQFFSSVFPWLVPTSGLKRLRTIYDRRDDRPFLESFLALDIWITDNVPFPGEVYRQIVKHGYQENRLAATGTWPFTDREAKLADVTIPVLNVVAKHDHVSPSESCSLLEHLPVSGPVTTRVHETGHLGIALGKDGKGQRTETYWNEIADWLVAPAAPPVPKPARVPPRARRGGRR